MVLSTQNDVAYDEGGDEGHDDARNDKPARYRRDNVAGRFEFHDVVEGWIAVETGYYTHYAAGYVAAYDREVARQQANAE